MIKEILKYGMYLACKQNICAGTNFLMSISDGLGPSIFCRKIERMRLVREEMDGNLVYFKPESAFLFGFFWLMYVLFPICSLTWRVSNYVSRQKREMKVRERTIIGTKAVKQFTYLWKLDSWISVLSQNKTH